MILNELPGSISNIEEFKERNMSDEDCGNKRVSIPKLCEKKGWDRIDKSEAGVPTKYMSVRGRRHENFVCVII